MALNRFLCALHVYDCAEEKGHEGEASGEEKQSCDAVNESKHRSVVLSPEYLPGTTTFPYILRL